MKKYLFFSSILVLTLALMLGSVLEVKAQAPVEYTTNCAYGSSLTVLGNKLSNAEAAVNSLDSSLSSDKKTNLQKRLDFVWVKFNILCMQEAFNTPATYLDISDKVSSLFTRYTSTAGLLGSGTSGERLYDFNDTRWSVLDTELNDVVNAPTGSDKGSIAYQISNYSITLSCAPLTVVNNDKVMNGSSTYSINFDIDGAGALTSVIDPATAPTLVYDASATADACTFKCDTNYTWDGTDTCNPDIANKLCLGTKPTNNVKLGSDNLDVTWTGTVFPNASSWNEKAVGTPASSLNACEFSCNSGNHYEGGDCKNNIKTVTCDGYVPPSNVAKGQTSTSITWAGSWPTTPLWTLQTGTGSLGVCKFRCNPGYHLEGNSCVSNTKTVNCGGTIPSGYVANGATSWTENWVNHWTGGPTNRLYTYNTTAGTCNYAECVQGKTKVSGTCYNNADIITLPNVNMGGISYALNSTYGSKNKYCSNKGKSYVSGAYTKISASNPFNMARWNNTSWVVYNSTDYVSKLVCN